MRWDYLPLDINPVFPGLGGIIITIIIIMQIKHYWQKIVRIWMSKVKEVEEFWT